MPVIKFAQMEKGQTYKTSALLINTVQKVTRTDKTYLELELSDGEAKIIAKKWDASLAGFAFETGKLIDVTLMVKDYNGGTDYTINEYSTCIDPNLKPEDFVLRVPYDVNNLYTAVVKIVAQSPEPGRIIYKDGESTIADLTISLLNKYKEEYSVWAAAKAVHHALYGGLVFHSYRMAYNAAFMSKIYKIADREMLICGAALHDIGKIVEMSSFLGAAEYTPRGRKLGHAYIGMRMIEEEAAKGNYPEDRVEELLHMIASHHGLGEYGAITYPATVEADMLHYIDMIDAHVYEYEVELKKVEPGGISAQRVFGLDGNTITRPDRLTDEILDSIFKNP